MWVVEFSRNRLLATSGGSLLTFKRYSLRSPERSRKGLGPAAFTASSAASLVALRLMLPFLVSGSCTACLIPANLYVSCHALVYVTYIVFDSPSSCHCSLLPDLRPWNELLHGKKENLVAARKAVKH